MSFYIRPIRVIKMKDLLLKNPYEDLRIFRGIGDGDIFRALKCLCAVEKTYKKDDRIIRFGEAIRHLSILLSGNVYLYQLNSMGERNIISQLRRGDLIGGTLVFSENPISPYDILCVDSCTTLLIDPTQIQMDRPPLCPFKNRIMKNLLFMIAEENHILREKLDLTAVKSLREKIFTYLHLQFRIHKTHSFTIPFVNRADFADYLGVNCSALSRELGRMRDEGILDFYKNSFVLKHYPSEEKKA